MKRRILSSLMCLLCCIAGGMLFQPVPAAKGQGDRPERRYITGTVVGVGGRLGGRTLPFELIVNSYSSPEEVQRLNAALQSGGQDELLRALSGMNAGQVRIGSGVGVPANVIIATPQPGGEVKLTVLYQRNVSFFELRYGTRSADYKIGYAEIYLRQNGNSEGTLIPAAKVRLRNDGAWEVEDFGEFPARLMGLRVHTSRSTRGA